MDDEAGLSTCPGVPEYGCYSQFPGTICVMNLELWFFPDSFIWFTACRRHAFPTFCGCSFECCAPFFMMALQLALEIASADLACSTAWTLNRDDAIFVDTDGVGVSGKEYVMVTACYNFSACRRHFLSQRAMCSGWPLPVRDDLVTVPDTCAVYANSSQQGYMQWIADHFTSAAITLLAIMQLSLWRLIFYGCALKGGSTNVDNLIRGGRKVTRGAPMKFWCIFMVTLLATGAAMPPRSRNINEAMAQAAIATRINRLSARIDEALTVHQRASDMWSGRLVFPQQVFPAHPDVEVEGDEFSDLEELRPEVGEPTIIPIRILKFQCIDYYTSMLAPPGTTTDEVLAYLNDAILRGDDYWYITEVYPQPDDQVVSVVVMPKWWRRTNFTAVVIDPSDCGQPIYCSVLLKRASFHDVCNAASPLSPHISGVEAFVENAMYPIGDESTVRPNEGTLIRIQPQHRIAEPLLELDIALQNLQWIHDVAANGLPRPGSAEGRVILGLIEHSVLLTTTHPPSHANIRRQVASILRTQVDDVELVWPQTEIPDTAMRGKPACAMVGAYTRQQKPVHDQWCAVFLDARNLGCKLAFRIFESRFISLSEILERLDFEVPSGMRALVDGFEYRVDSNGKFLFTMGAIVSVWLEEATSAPVSGSSDTPIVAEDERSECRGAAIGEGQGTSGSSGERPSAGSDLRPDTRERSRSPRDHCAVFGSEGSDLTLLQSSCLTNAGRDSLSRSIQLLQDKLELQCARTIPTPCRGLLRLPLLSEDTIPEVATDASVVREQAPSQVVSIAAAIGAHDYSMAQNCLELMPPDYESLFWQFLEPWRPGSLCTDCSYGELHPNTIAALTMIGWETPCGFPDMIEMYTDGSAKNQQAGYAVVVVAHWRQHGKVQHLGNFGGRVCLDTGDNFYIGATDSDAMNAELTALFWALLWVLAHHQGLCQPVITIRYDATSAGGIAAGCFNFGGSALGLKTRAVAQLLEQTMGMQRLRWVHVRGHDGQPFNEMADTVAGWCRESDQHGIPGPRPRWCMSLNDLNFDWMVMLPMGIRHGSVPPLAAGKLVWNEDPGPVSIMSAEDIIPTVTAEKGGRFRLQVKMISANVQTGIGEVKYFEEQLSHQSVHIFACQETKGREGLIKSVGFFRIASDSQHFWGTEIWINKLLPFGQIDGKPVYVEESNVNVVGTSPRHVHATLRLGGQTIHVASMHLPQQNRDVTERAEMEMRLVEIAKKAGSHICLIGIDANARVPPSFFDATGSLVPQEPDDAGVQFAAILRQETLWAINTYESVHQGSLETWVHPGGKQSQIDFVLSNHNLPKTCVSSFINHGFDLLNVRDDHFALEVNVDFTFFDVDVDRKKLRRGMGWDLRALDCPDVQASLAAAIDARAIATVPWDWGCEQACTVSQSWHRICA